MTNHLAQLAAVALLLVKATGAFTALPSRGRSLSTRLSQASTTAHTATENSPGKKILKEPQLWEYHFGMQDNANIPLPHGIVRDVTPPEIFRVTEEQVTTLEREGVVVLRGVLDEDWVNYMRQATAYQVEHPHFWSLAGTASKLYDYIQRNVWQTNRSFADFYYHSAIGDVLRQCGRTQEIRLSTDLLLVNPNKGFKWHQDNQNGPIRVEDGIRFWITLDATPKDYGSPVYLKGSHCNSVVPPEAVFVDIDQPGLEDYKDNILQIENLQPGDMVVWHPKTIHKIDGSPSGTWSSYRRVIAGTVAKQNTRYQDKRGTGGILSDLGHHGLKQDDLLKSPLFPQIYPHSDPTERTGRDRGQVSRSFPEMISKIGGIMSAESAKRFGSFMQVVNR